MREQETLSAEAYRFINPWLILYLLVITLVEAGLHLLDIIETKADPDGLGRKNFKIYTQTTCFNQKL